MKKILEKVLAVVLTLTMMLTAAPLSGFVGLDFSWLTDLFSIKASAATYSGECGDNLTWTFDEETGVLDITGTGDMYDWTWTIYVPWDSYRSSIKAVTIGNSVTSIENYAFSYCDSLTSITIPDSVTSIGISTFAFCRSLTSVTIGNSVTRIGESAFEGCYRLTSMTITDSVTMIGDSAFDSCSSLTDVYYGGSEAEWKKITINSSNYYLTSATIHHSSPMPVSADLKYGADRFSFGEDITGYIGDKIDTLLLYKSSTGNIGSLDI